MFKEKEKTPSILSVIFLIILLICFIILIILFIKILNDKSMLGDINTLLKIKNI